MDDELYLIVFPLGVYVLLISLTLTPLLVMEGGPIDQINYMPSIEDWRDQMSQSRTMELVSSILAIFIVFAWSNLVWYATSYYGTVNKNFYDNIATVVDTLKNSAAVKKLKKLAAKKRKY
jgi:hypothetical protein